MTIVPVFVTCPKCYKKYNINPDVGKLKCPYCHGLGTPLTNLVEKIVNDKKKAKTDSKK